MAQRVMPGPVFDYVEGGADEEISVAENIRSFRRWRFNPQLLTGGAVVDTASSVLGTAMRLPLALGPTGCTRMMHPAGEIAVARAAHRHGLAYTLSTMATTTIEDVRSATADADLWFQLYVQSDAVVTKDLVNRAAASGYRVLMVTVDTPIPGHRIRDERNGLVIPPRLSPMALARIAARPGYWSRMLRSPAIGFPNLDGARVTTIAQSSSIFDPTIDWQTITDLRSQWPGRLVIKGPLGPAAARRAIDAGADGIVLSNHGGRQLDRIQSPLERLPHVREEVGPTVPLLVDSGVRHGSDIAVAIALGADAAMIGRAYLYGLMAGGEEGVYRALELLGTEFTRTLQLLGVRSVAELQTAGRDLITFAA